MNTLTREMKRSLKELELGLKGELTMTSEMENLSNSLFFDQVLRDNVHTLKILYLGSPKLGEASVCLPEWVVCLVRRPAAKDRGTPWMDFLRVCSSRLRLASQLLQPSILPDGDHAEHGKEE